ncbi:MAG: ABC transporter permease [Clostridia bacterium]|nr:ABC transporter permease [Clostridia bacterium]
MFRISKRAEMKRTHQGLVRIAAILVSLVAMSGWIVAIGHNPLMVYKAMLDGCFGSTYRVLETIKYTIPLGLAALGVMLAFKMKFWNIGGEGQILMGAFAATYFALNFSDMPKTALLLLMMISAMIMGGLWSLIPAIFKVSFGTNETVFTLMLNYIALKYIIYLQYGPWKDPMAFGFPKIPNFSDNAILPKVFGLHIGWIILLLATVVVYVIFHHTKIGFEIAVIGESENTAKYAGMTVRRTVMKAVFLSGGLCGLVGMIQASAVSNTLTFELSSGIGYDAIIVAWLSNMNPMMVPLVAFLFAILSQGASFIQTAFQIPQSAAEIIQGMILIFALSAEFFIRYKLSLVDRSAKGGQHA